MKQTKITNKAIKGGCLTFSKYWVSQKLGYIFFLYYGSSSAYLPLTSFKTILLDYIVTAVILMCLRKISKNGEFLCSHLNIEDGRRYTTFFSTLCFIVARKVKIQLRHKRKICAVYGEGAMTDRM